MNSLIDDCGSYFVYDKKAMRVKTELNDGVLYMYINDIMIMGIYRNGLIKFSMYIKIDESMQMAHLDMNALLGRHNE